MLADKITVDVTSVDKVTANEMTIDEMTLDEMTCCCTNSWVKSARIRPFSDSFIFVFREKNIELKLFFC
jgi:hypothetical protein